MWRIHLDTDLGSDTDDLRALAMLLGWSGVELTGITTVSDPQGLRVGFINYILELAGHKDIAVAAGAEGSLGGFLTPIGFADIPKYWPKPITPWPCLPGAALDLLAKSIAAGATIVGIGPCTNLAMLEVSRPGTLALAEVVLTGGHLPLDWSGLPKWGLRYDYNIQQDKTAARIVFERCNPILVPLPVTLRVTLRVAQLRFLQKAGRVGALIASQAELHGKDERMQAMGRRHNGLPNDLLCFQYDPLACAVAVGWDGVRIEELPLVLAERRGLLRFVIKPGGKPTRVVTAVDAERFANEWLSAIARVG